ncbi:DnaJ C-terminal domain-containing protein [Chromobacterium sphagni]|uniref:Cytochrome C biogenesis protein n=1 Tax=Chromobacterium sphagni TaxID=1903179 RepID=A0ABX3CBI4_9NEIS|nr:DnaJ C-terminal domain-containing protein [Chromobacterium sphagni]OHX19653.1 cytochrome C biogenesis protein [Chromobacterium sphagni]
MKFHDFYETLGVPRDAPQEEVKRAYRKLARKFHPDVSKVPEAEARFKELGEAYAVLKDPEKRTAYDLMGSGLKAGQDFQPPPGWDAGFEFSGDGFRPETGADQDDFFEALFGRRTRGAARSHAHGAGQDHHAKVLIDLEDAYRGCERSVALRMPMQDAQGHVVLQARTLMVAIPKGIRAGQHLRLAGQGGPGAGGGQPGDLYLEIEFRPHPLFRVDGRDVFLELPLAPWEAALGATVEAPTPDGPVQLKVPPGSAAGRQLRMKGRGIPGATPGDLYVALKISLPPVANERDRAAYLAMADAFDFNPRGAQKG